MSRKISRPNRFLVLTILVLFCQLSFAATPVCIVPPTGLVSWWTADSDASDLYGVNNPSAVNAVSLVSGKVGNGYTFGTNGYIQIPDSSSLDNQKFTWDAWVMPNGPGPNNDGYGSMIVEKGIDNTHGSFDLLWRDNPDNRFLFFSGDQFSELIESKDTFPPGVFYFVAATYDGATFKLYVNGVLEGSLAEKKTIPYTSAHTWQIGSTDAIYRSEGFPRTFNGVIDEVEAFSVALSSAKILSIYKAGIAGKCKAPVIVTPASKSFASQIVGTTSAPKAITITNNRNVTLTFNGVTFTGTNSADFAGSSTTCGSTLAARKNCKVNVTFTPGATGKRSAVLNVNDSGPGSPQTAALKGTGK